MAGLFSGARAGVLCLAALCAAIVLGLGEVEGGEQEGAHAGEPPAELIGLGGQFQARSTAPFGSVAPGALAAAHAQKAKLAGTNARWAPVGQTPMRSDDPTYAISKLGHGTLSGRATAFADDPAHAGHHWVSASGGGVWETTDDGATWSSIGDGLPSQTVGAIGYSAANHTLIVGTGDNAFAGTAFSGLGVYRTTNDGGKWRKALGIPDEILSFRIAFDRDDPTGKTVYAATSKGLYRSTDAGASFTNVNLPTSANCAGNTTDQHCFFANVVTDVVVRAQGHAVLAAVGWRAGRMQDKDGTVQAPGNGLYRSDTGEPGSFTFVDAGESAPSKNGFAINPVVGRTALAAAHGLGQSPDVVYALVQDAQKFQGCVDALDVELACQSTAAGAGQGGTVLDGAYVSRDFGRTWKKIMDWAQLKAPGTNSALSTPSSQPTYSPGVQSWYNLWIDTDPTQADPLTGAPTRVFFGLEEVWENQTYPAPVIGPTDWHVIGRYWNACFGGVTVTSGLQCNGPTDSVVTTTTTHPDQHADLLVPDGAGGVTLFVGNDGGVYSQHAGVGGDFDNDSWGKGANVGLHTLQPYDAAIAKDGSVVAGLQDNGEVLIEPGTQRSVAIYGGDGFDTGIDPDNSSNIVEEYAAGVVSVSNSGGRGWTRIDPALTSPLFWTPLIVDPANANHFVIGGRNIKEHTTGYGSDTSWTQLYDLGTAASGAARQTSALDISGTTIYAGYCGYCDVVTQGTPFDNGVATNAGGVWHIAAAVGLPKRYITSIRIDPANANTVYATLGGYGRRWVPPGALGDDVSQVGEGHVFKSIDGGQTFTDISGNLPDVPANWSVVRNGQLLVATDIGVFFSGTTAGGTWSVLGRDLPTSPVLKIHLDPGSADHLIAVTYGRGVYEYRFAKAPPTTAGTAQPAISGSVTTLGPAADAETTTQSVTGATFEFDALPGFDNSRLLADAIYTGPADVDLSLQVRNLDGSWSEVSSSTSSRLDGESLQYGSPAPGHYRLVVLEYLGPPLLKIQLNVSFFNAANQKG